MSEVSEFCLEKVSNLHISAQLSKISKDLCKLGKNI